MMRMVPAGVVVVAGWMCFGLAVADTPFHAGGDGVAVGGYDVVAYFTDGRPVKGRKGISAEHEGAVFRFSSEANKRVFVADPVRYAPRYGGHCAWAVAHGYTARGSPRHWKVVDGRLYLNYNGSVQRRWVQDMADLISRGDANWPAVLK